MFKFIQSCWMGLRSRLWPDQFFHTNRENYFFMGLFVFGTLLFQHDISYVHRVLQQTWKLTIMCKISWIRPTPALQMCNFLINFIHDPSSRIMSYYKEFYFCALLTQSQQKPNIMSITKAICYRKITVDGMVM